MSTHSKEIKYCGCNLEKCSTEKIGNQKTTDGKSQENLSSSTGLKVAKSLKVWKTSCWMANYTTTKVALGSTA